MKIKHFITRNYKELACSLSCWWRYSFISNTYHFLTIGLWEKSSRSIAFAKIGWNNYDWDYSPIHSLMLFKLKRLQYTFIHHGHHATTCHNYAPKMKSLALTIKLLERYCSDDGYEYYHKPIDKHNLKWGSLESETTPCDMDEDGYVTTYKWETSRSKAVTPEDEEQERKEFMEASNLTDERQNRDIRIAYHIIAKYNRYWWD